MMGAVNLPTGFHNFNFVRERGEARFSTRAAKMLDIVLRELGPISPTRLAPMRGDSVLELPMRLRQVLFAMAQGDNEKQIAVLIGISRNTVHEYVRRLYVRYGVASRGELLVRTALQMHALEASVTVSADYWFYRHAAAS